MSKSVLTRNHRPGRRPLGWIVLAVGLASCAQTPQRVEERKLEAPRMPAERVEEVAGIKPGIGARDGDTMLVSLVWETAGAHDDATSVEYSNDAAYRRFLFEARANTLSDPLEKLRSDGHLARFTPGPVLELEMECSRDSLKGAIAGALEWAELAQSAEARSPASEFPAYLADAWRGWQRRAAFGVEENRDTVSWRWHAAVLARPDDFAFVETTFASLGNDGRFKTVTAEESMVGSGFALEILHSRASLLNEVRWIPRAECWPNVAAEDRARWSVRAAVLARQVAGWTYVPACVDSWGRREPFYLYTSGDFASCAKRVAALRVGLEAQQAIEDARLVRDQRVRFSRAQLREERFRMHALHGDQLPRFEEDLAALEALDDDTLKAPNPTEIERWSVVGPSAAWISEMSDFGNYKLLQLPVESTTDAQAESDLAKMWSALGGSERWRDLKSMRNLGLMTQSDGTSQGTEQWFDFESGRFALSQAVGTQETLISATAAEAWIFDQANGVDITTDQASKLRGRHERTLFTLLRELAQPGHPGMIVLKNEGRLVIVSSARVLCSLELDERSLPKTLKYTLDGASEESVYEFHDWKLDAPLPYPARMLQVDRGATVELQHVEPNAVLDPLLWTREKR